MSQQNITGSSGPYNIITEENVETPMRDGVVLRADVYRPDDPGPFPVLVMRTPYNKSGRLDNLVQAGYIVVKQDVRGRYASDGEWESFVRSETHDAEDGYDTVEWAARLPGSTGKVGTFGVSYNAFLQWRLAALRPPSLVAMWAVSVHARMTDLEGPGAIRPGRRLKWWIGNMAPDMRKRKGAPGPHAPDEGNAAWRDPDREKWLWFLPYGELPDYILQGESDAIREWLRRPYTDPWQLDKGHSEIDAPNFHITGYFDHCNPCLDHFTGMVANGRTERARRNQKLVIGPWNHTGLGAQKCGEIDFGQGARFDQNAAMIRWFDYWLKGIPNGVDEDPPVRIFIMGQNRWRAESEWPLSRARDLTLFLSSGGGANTPAGDGNLMPSAPADGGQDEYDYDPRDPVMTLYGEAMFTVPADQRPLAHRSDILVYQTEPLTEGIEVTGYPHVILYASSSAPDTDFFARLIDVAPDGANRDICTGMVRARYRHSLERSELLKPGEVIEFKIKLGPTSNKFLEGHRIRLDITSSDFPNYDRNHNTGLDDNFDATLAAAHQTIRHGGRGVSRLILPWIMKRG